MSETNKKYLEALEGKLRDGISASTIEGGWVSVHSVFDNLDAFTKELEKTKKQVITNIEAALKVFDDLSEVCVSKGIRAAKTDGLVKDLFSKEEIEGLVTKLVGYFLSLPRNFWVFAELPQLRNGPVSIEAISGKVAAYNIVAGEPPATENLFEALGQQTQPKGIPGGFFIRVACSGYARADIESSAVSMGVSIVKQFIYLAFLERQIDFEVKYSPWGGGKLEGSVWVMDQAQGSLPIKVEIPTELSRTLGMVKLKEKDPPNPELASIVGLISPKEPTIPKYLSIGTKGAGIIDNVDPGENVSSFKNALEWGFDSLSNDKNQTLSFIQICVALEAILGVDADPERLTKQLADRCAYLVGNSVTKRKQLRDNFNKFYTVRSKLIHGRKRHLERSDSHWLYWGRGVLDRILRRELFFSEF